MPRINYKRARAETDRLLDTVFATMTQERELDSAHIERHVEESKEQLARLEAAEKALVDYIDLFRENMITGIRETFLQMRVDEERRTASLRSHADAINDDGDAEIEKPAPVKRLKAAE